MAGMNLTVDENLIKPVIEAEIHSAIVANLAKVDDKIISAIVGRTLNALVDDDGKVSSSHYNNKTNYLDWLIGNTVREATKLAVQDYFENNKGKLMDAVIVELNNSTTDLAKVFVEGLAGAIKSSWNFKVDVILPQRNC